MQLPWTRSIVTSNLGYYLDASDEASEVREDSFNTAKLIEMALTSGAYNLLNARQVQDWLEDRINRTQLYADNNNRYWIDTQPSIAIMQLLCPTGI